MQNDRAVDVAAKLILIIHRSIDWSIWGNKRLTYWSTIENSIRSAAYTTDLGRFVATLCLKMSINAPGRDKAARAELAEIVALNRDREILQSLREQTALVVVKIRVASEDKKQARKERNEQNVTSGDPAELLF